MSPRTAFTDLIERVSQQQPVFSTALAHLSVFPPSWDNGWRCLDQHVIHLVLRGQGLCDVRSDQGSHTITFGPGDLLWVAPACTFRTHAVPGDPPTVHHIRFRVDDATGLIGLDGKAHHLQHCGEWRALFDQWAQAYRRSGTHLSAQQQACLLLLASAVHDRLVEPDISGGLNADQRGIIEQYLRGQGHQPDTVTAGDLARAVGLGQAYFTRRFTRSYGLPPRTWILHQRLARAAALLVETNSSIAGIATVLGYAQVALFCRQFKARYGVSPTAYRRRHYSPYGR